MSPRTFRSIAEVLKARSGLVVGEGKQYFMENRLAPILTACGLTDFAELATLMSTDDALERAVVEAMTTNESLFFRDIKPFDALRRSILPGLHASRPPGAKLRIWSAAAARGQEAYSIAMVVAEMRASLGDRRIEILGTDIARAALASAEDGLYTQFEIARGVPMQILPRYFRREGEQWRVTRELREATAFREWNLLHDTSPLGVFDVVFLRNVLIYFDTTTKKAVLERIAEQLAGDGVLFLGGVETAVGLSDRLASIAEIPGAYQKRTKNFCSLAPVLFDTRG